MSEGRSSSISSAPHPPTFSALAGDFRTEEDAAEANPLPLAVAVAEVLATDAPTVIDSHAGGVVPERVRLREA